MKKSITPPSTKTMSITFINGDTRIERSLEVTAKTDLSTIIGTFCNDLFDWVNMQKQGSVKLFNLSKQFDFKIDYDGVSVDTSKINSTFKTKFKLNSDVKRQKHFAQAVYAVVKKFTAAVTVKDVETIVKECEVILSERKLVKVA